MHRYIFIPRQSLYGLFWILTGLGCHNATGPEAFEEQKEWERRMLQTWDPGKIDTGNMASCPIEILYFRLEPGKAGKVRIDYRLKEMGHLNDVLFQFSCTDKNNAPAGVFALMDNHAVDSGRVQTSYLDFDSKTARKITGLWPIVVEFYPPRAWRAANGQPANHSVKKPAKKG